MDGSSSFLEVVMVFLISLGVVGVFVGGFVWISLYRDRRIRRKLAAGPHPLAMLHAAGWNYVVDGTVIAELAQAGIPEDPNTNFVPFDVSIVPGHETDIETLLYRSNHRNPDDARICYRSRGTDALTLTDSQVLASGQDGRVTLKVYWPEDPA